jgi:hypothetical protein
MIITFGKTCATLGIATIANGIAAYRAYDDNHLSSYIIGLKNFSGISDPDFKVLIILDLLCSGFLASTVPALFCTAATKALSLSALQGTLIASPILFFGYDSGFKYTWPTEWSATTKVQTNVSKAIHDLQNAKSNPLTTGWIIMNESLKYGGGFDGFTNIYKINTMIQTALFNMIWAESESSPEIEYSIIVDPI